MNWLRWSRRRAGQNAVIPAVASPVGHVVGPARLSADSGRLIHEDADGRRQATLLIDGLQLLACYGEVSVDARCLAALAEQHVAVAFMSSDGRRMRARISPEDDPHVVARVLQHRVLADETLRSRLASEIVREKIHSQAAAARHYQRQGKRVDREDLEQLSCLEHRASETTHLQSLLGLEGTAANRWFTVMGRLLHSPWRFERRTRRPPADPVNALLSLGYTMLYHRIAAACMATGLETGLGALHAYRAGRQSLACDIMEPLRAPVVDRWVIGLLNQRRLSPRDFQAVDADGVRLTKRAFPRVLADWERHWHKTHMPTIAFERVRAFSQSIRDLAPPAAHTLRCLEASGIAEIG